MERNRKMPRPKTPELSGFDLNQGKWQEQSWIEPFGCRPGFRRFAKTRPVSLKPQENRHHANPAGNLLSMRQRQEYLRKTYGRNCKPVSESERNAEKRSCPAGRFLDKEILPMRFEPNERRNVFQIIGGIFSFDIIAEMSCSYIA